MTYGTLHEVQTRAPAGTVFFRNYTVAGTFSPTANDSQRPGGAEFPPVDTWYLHGSYGAAVLFGAAAPGRDSLD